MAPNATTPGEGALTQAATGNNNTDAQADVPVHAVAMKLLDVRLKPSTAIVASIAGSFTAVGMHEIALLRSGGTIEIHRIVTSVGDDEGIPQTLLKLISRTETRSILRACVKVRYPGEQRDVLAVTADSGCLSVLDFQSRSSTSACQIVHCVSFGKTACRRDTPGQYIAADPAGRAVMVSAVEKRKLVYVLNRDATGTPTMASPLEAHRNRTIALDTVGIDNGHGNPMFAVLELQYPDYSEVDDVKEVPPVTKQLAYYELDLGLNHVSRRWAATTHRTASCLVAVPGGADGPSGVLVGSEDWIEYMHETFVPPTVDAAPFSNIVCALPRRQLHPSDKGVLVTKITVHRQKKSKFFALAQTELGDVYKVVLVTDSSDKTKVTGMKVHLLDTLPPAISLNVSELGMLFVAAEFGDHPLYRFLRIDLPDAPTSTSEMTAEAYHNTTGAPGDVESFLTTAMASRIAPTFVPTILKNLRKVFALDNPSPTTGVMVGELAGNEVSPQIYTLTGRGPSSHLRILRHGAAVTELAVSELPGVPGAIFTIADPTAEGMDKYVVVSFADATLVLSVGDSIEEVGKESGFLTNAPTLACSALGTDGALCQVHPAGVRHIQKGQAKQWHCPGLKRIECASANESQVIIVLAGGEIIYFELDAMSGNLTESKTRDLGADICCLDVGTIAKGQSRSLFAAIGCRDQTVRIVSLEPGNSLLAQRSSTALRSRPHSVSLQMMSGSGEEGRSAAGSDDLTLLIGLDDGSSLRASVDPITGSIGASPSRRFLGARPVSVSRITLDAQPAALLLSSRPWISRRDATSGKHVMAPLSFAPLDQCCSFRSEAVREGVIATAGKTLRILSVDVTGMGGGDDEAFNTNKVELRYTPRQMTLINTSFSTGNAENPRIGLVVIESDCNEYGWNEKKAMGFDPTGEAGTGKSSQKEDDDAMDMDEGSDDEGAAKEKKEDAEDGDVEEEEKESRKTPIRGPVPILAGSWGSCMRLLDPTNNCATLDCVEFNKNEAALCCTSVRFHSKGGEPLLAVGTVTGMTMHPLKVETSHIALYRIVNGDRFQLLHRTAVEDGPVLALAHFHGRLVVGIGKCLRIYEMGKRQLLRKCELRNLPTFVKTIQTVGDRAFVGDMMQSIQIVRYDSTSNRLVLIANDGTPRPIVSQELLDWNTVAVGDKFGNISVLRLPRGADSGAMDGSGQRALWDSARDDRTPKLELLCQYYVGEIVTSMTRSALVAGGPESLIYVTVAGRIGALVPFTSRDQVDLYVQLESLLRADAPRPTGRDPKSYRSYYAPVLHVVDGELCDAFNALSHKEQVSIAERLDLSVTEIAKKLEDTHNALL
jgi:splicing factor 3B subunit 3